MSKNGKFLFTSESVTEGHPDKVCDQVSDAVLDDLLAQDPKSRVACETLVTTGLVLIAGEVSSLGYTDLQKVVRETVKEIGYVKAAYGFDYETCSVLSSIHDQSSDIAIGVDENEGHEQGPGGAQVLALGDVSFVSRPLALTLRGGEGLFTTRAFGHDAPMSFRVRGFRRLRTCFRTFGRGR